MWRLIHYLPLTLLLAAPLASAQAEERSNDDIRRLDDEVQEAKKDVLDIATEFNALEQRLLYPSATRLTIYLAMARNEGARLSATEVRIDDEVVVHHVYSEAELTALQKGGVQNLFTGNVTLGAHELKVGIIGELPNGSGFTVTKIHDFTKGADAKTLNVTLDLAAGDDNGIRVGDR